MKSITLLLDLTCTAADDSIWCAEGCRQAWPHLHGLGQGWTRHRLL